ncbi:leucine--tRNA ligase [Candidatus Uhrbacteria bacterium]|nr:leucine--tRNA ligase [Candidatus Uhrbacteria bacterium]
MKYDHKKIEKKWQGYWEKNRTFEVDEDSDKKKYYCLDMFPYPSGDGLHVGHPEGYTATDIFSRYLRMHGYNVLHPMGWDAFGLPAENFAIKKSVHPSTTTKKNIDHFRTQIKSLGFSYDWNREVNTASEEYYKWTQWLFLELYTHGLAYKKKAPVNWCPSCQTVLANEQVENGVCERCEHTVVQKELEQWFFKVTQYAEQLLNDLDSLDWPDPIKNAQRNWIGKSEGSLLQFPLVGKNVPTYRYVLLHGYDGSPDGIFFPWLKKELEKRGSSVTVPKLPHSDTPQEQEQVDYVLKHCKFDQCTILFGHSLGAVIALKVAEKLSSPIAGLVLAGGFIENNFRDQPRPFDSTFSWKFDFEKITRNAGNIKIISEQNDYAIPREQGRKIQAALGGSLTEVAGEESHFIGEKEPALLAHLAPTISVFTTRPDTLFGATYMVIAPEHPLIMDKKLGIENHAEVSAYVSNTKKKSERERLHLQKEKTGVELKGVRAVNPATGKEIPIWIADYCVASYGTGAIMAVPAHDQRDFEFAKKFGLPITMVICPHYPAPTCPVRDEAYIGPGHLVESGQFTGMASTEATHEITNFAGGVTKINYKIRDWLISRQRYWGAPIPIIYCEACGEVPVPQIDLPVFLPTDVDFRPTGESPLTRSASFHDVKCPSCGAHARRESDTMDTFVCSSWYFLRYSSAHSANAPFEKEKIEYWLPVDMYVGGAEHAVLHLLYARFITKALRDMGYLNFSEPFSRLRNQGLILGEDGEKMSKSRGNVINPDEIIELYGADTMRLYEMFMGPFEDAKPWSTKSIIGIRRFLEKVWRVYECQRDRIKWTESKILEKMIHKTVKKVTEDIVTFKFNTAISALMICTHALTDTHAKGEKIPISYLEKFILLLSPFAPHMAEELWQGLGKTDALAFHPWPTYDPTFLEEEMYKLIIQINGKVRDSIEISKETTEDEIKKIALGRETTQKWLEGKTISHVIVIPNRLINIVVE